MESATANGMAQGGIRVLLRLEGLAILSVAIWLYSAGAYGWGQFALLFFVPDLSFAGYLLGPRAGALAYNCAHSTLGPATLVALTISGWHGLMPIALIWFAHVGFDRSLGYGLKYASGFHDTHLGRIGRR